MLIRIKNSLNITHKYFNIVLKTKSFFHAMVPPGQIRLLSSISFILFTLVFQLLC